MRDVILALAVVFILGGPAAAAANDWPQFRFDETHQGAVPSSGNNELKPFVQKWWNNVSVKGPVSSPSIRDGIVYIGDAQGNLFAFDLESGGLIWQNKTVAGARIKSAPAVGPETVYVITDTGNLYGFERRKGDLRPGFPISVGASDGTIMFHEDTDNLYIGTRDGNMKSYFASTQQARWTFNTGGDWKSTFGDNNSKCDPGSIDGAPIVYTTSTESYVMFGSVNHCFYAIKRSSFGTISQGCSADVTQNCLVWLFKATGSIRSSPIVDKVNQRIIFGDDAGTIYAIPLDSTGFVTDATYTYKEPTSAGVDAEFFASPAIWGSYVYVASRDGNLTKLRTSDLCGSCGYVRNLGFQGISSSPAIANGILSIGGLSGRFFLLNATDLSDMGSFDKAEIQADDVIETSPAISGTQVVWGSRLGTLYSYGGVKPQRPDLAITSFSPSGIYTGQATTITATIQNVGALPSAATVATFYFPSGSVQVEVPALNKSQQYTLTAPFTATGTGEISIRLLLDSTHSVKESDESNNDKTVKTTVASVPVQPSAPSSSSGGSPGFEFVLLAMAAVFGLVISRRK